jgi:hypothetical protein
MRAGNGLGLSLALLAAVACDRGPEVGHLEQVRALCAQVAQARSGAAEAEALFGPESFTFCASDLPPASSSDACPRGGASVCVRVWAWRAHNEPLCGGPACSYGCELRAPDGAPEATCSVRFLTGREPPAAP